MTTTPGYVPPTPVTDPFSQTKFRVVWDDITIPGISSVSPLEMTIAGGGSTSDTGDGTTIGTTVGSTGTVIATAVGSTPGSTTGPTNVLTAAEAAAEEEAAAALAAAEQAASNAVQSAENTAQSVISSLDPFAERRARGPEITQWVVSPVEFTRPRTADESFQSWALAPVPKLVLVELFNLAGGPGLTFQLVQCVPIAYVPLDSVDAESAGVALERLTIRCASIVTVPGEPASPLK